MSRLDSITDWEQRAEQARWRVAPLAAGLQISRQWLARYIRQHRDVCLGQWLRECRLRSALGLLQPGTPIKNVALDLGYKQVTHFNRAFKRALGMTPGKFLSNQRTWTATFQNGHKVSQMVIVAAGVAARDPGKDASNRSANPG